MRNTRLESPLSQMSSSSDEQLTIDALAQSSQEVTPIVDAYRTIAASTDSLLAAFDDYQALPEATRQRDAALYVDTTAAEFGAMVDQLVAADSLDKEGIKSSYFDISQIYHLADVVDAVNYNQEFHTVPPDAKEAIDAAFGEIILTHSPSGYLTDRDYLLGEAYKLHRQTDQPIIEAAHLLEGQLQSAIPDTEHYVALHRIDALEDPRELIEKFHPSVQAMVRHNPDELTPSLEQTNAAIAELWKNWDAEQKNIPKEKRIQKSMSMRAIASYARSSRKTKQ